MRNWSRIIFLAVALLSSIAYAGKKESGPSLFEGVHTIELIDASNPVLLASTDAKRVREFFEIGLKHLGYKVCNDCKSSADAVATILVSKNRTIQDRKRDWAGWGNQLVVASSESSWKITVVRNGVSIFEQRKSHSQPIPLDTLVGKQVQDVLNDIPPHKQE
jgi:phosphoketolase